MKILVTGGCGYVGTVLVPKLLSAGHQVCVLDTQWFGNHLQDHENLYFIKQDIRNLVSLSPETPDCIIHLAGIANDPTGELDPKLTWETNALATMQLADSAARSGVKQFIYASSGSVYGISDEPTVVEDAPLHPLSEYNKTKMVAERVLLSYADKMAVQIVRPATVCGFSPRMRLDVAVNMLTAQAMTKGVITVFGGAQMRPNIHIEDMTDLYVYLLNRPELTGVYNAGFENKSLMEIAQSISNRTKAKINVVESNDERSYRQSSDKLIKTGFKPKRTVNMAIAEMEQKFLNGQLEDKDQWYNLRTMKLFI